MALTQRLRTLVVLIPWFPAHHAAPLLPARLAARVLPRGVRLSAAGTPAPARSGQTPAVVTFFLHLP